MSQELKSHISFIEYKKKYGYIKAIGNQDDYGFNTKYTQFSEVEFKDLNQGDSVYFTLNDKNFASSIRLCDDVCDVALSDNVKDSPNNVKGALNNVKGYPNKEDDFIYLTPDNNIRDSELIIGIVSPVGVNPAQITETLTNRLRNFKYDVEVIRVSELLPKVSGNKENERIDSLIKEGDKLREDFGNDILAKGVVGLIRKRRENNSNKKIAYIINSLKHPDEVELLRKVYNNGFYLLGVHANRKQRKEYLINDKQCTPQQADELINRDENEERKSGQKTRDTYHLADFFVNQDGDKGKKLAHTLQRFLDLIFSDPYKNPTFDEFAMFMAFNSSVRSSDLSRQVGAVLSRDKHILSVGCNDVPQFGGGLYWAELNGNGEIVDKSRGKDYTRKGDPNKKIQKTIIDNILKEMETHLDKKQLTGLDEVLQKSSISDLTEFGRVVHAEMEAILSCGRNGIATKDSTLYCTTFPCHNCAKHIVASGIKRVVYVEPYPKSRALELHDDSIVLIGESEEENNEKTEMGNKVIFEPFIGVGPRRFLDLFSMSLGLGTKLIRKDKSRDGATVEWKRDNNRARIRTPLSRKSYLEIEDDAIQLWERTKNCK